MLRFEGDKDFTLPPETLFVQLTDPAFLVKCLPDVESVTSVGPDEARLVLRPGFSFVRGTLEMTLRVLQRRAPADARIRMESRGIGTSSVVEATLALAPHGSGTRAHWVGEVKELGGLLKLVPSGLVRGAAQKIIGDVWNAVETKLSSRTGTS
jgi:carbon monoxide dehydrogenase subunit G